LNIVFLLNCSDKFGTGHLNRCSRIANALIKKNKIFFLIDKSNKNILNIIPKKSKIFLNNNFFKNKKKTKAVIKKLKNPILIIDSYLSNYTFEKYIKKFCKKLIVIDDLKKKHICDIYINQNCLNFGYANKIISKKKLMGLKYCLLDKKIFKIKSENKKYKKNILVFTGTRDSKNITLKIYNTIKMYGFYNYQFTFIIGFYNKNKNFLLSQKKIKNIKFKNFGNKFLQEMSKHNFFISAGGSSIWEALFLNKTNIVFNHSNNQFENSKNLMKLGYIHQFNKKLSINHIGRFLIDILSSESTIIIKKKIVDGRGLDRIVKYII
jgi:UDP-2,4-diacetamido-2,4,6-trideoxy-beta-L-altropyranose hydrolase